MASLFGTTLGGRVLGDEHKEFLEHYMEPEFQQLQLDKAKQRMENQQNFYSIHPHAAHHIAGPSPSFPAPKPTQSGPMSAKIGQDRQIALMGRLGVKLEAPTENVGDRSQSYPVANVFDFPTRFKITQPIGFVDMLVEDEYGNPVLCFHGGSWFLKRKMTIIDLRTGETVGKMEEELKAMSGKYKFKVFLDGKDETPFGTVMKLGRTEMTTLTTAELVVKTPALGKILARNPIDGTPTEFKHGEQIALSFLHSTIHQPLITGDVYFVEVGPGVDIRFMLSIIVSYDKFVTTN